MHSEDQADELSDRVYTALRDGGLSAELVVELACLLEEWDVSTPATRAQLTAADLTRLCESLLSETGFEPTFALEPRLWTTLEHALEIVKRDVRSGGITGALSLAIPDWDQRRQAWVEFQGGYHGNGIEPIAGSSAQGALAGVADAAQETIMELTWKVWPVCATHDLGLHVELVHRIAVWRCTGGGTHIVSPVGELPRM